LNLRRQCRQWRSSSPVLAYSSNGGSAEALPAWVQANANSKPPRTCSDAVNQARASLRAFRTAQQLGLLQPASTQLLPAPRSSAPSSTDASGAQVLYTQSSSAGKEAGTNASNDGASSSSGTSSSKPMGQQLLQWLTGQVSSGCTAHMSACVLSALLEQPSHPGLSPTAFILYLCHAVQHN
jgi:hypothetical protein